MNESLVTSNTFVSSPIAQSSAETGYITCSNTLTDTTNVKQVWNFVNKHHLNSTMILALSTDSKSAMTMIEIDHVTGHIERHVHFVKQARMQELFQVIQIPGKLIPADEGTKDFHWNKDTRKHLTAIHSYSPLCTNTPFEVVPQVKEECRNMDSASRFHRLGFCIPDSMVSDLLTASHVLTSVLTPLVSEQGVRTDPLPPQRDSDTLGVRIAAN